jgi:hypothetical protein
MNNVITISKVDIVTMTETVFENNVTIIETKNFTFEAKCSNQTYNFVKITEHFDSKLQVATSIVTAKVQQENEIFLKK